MRQAAVAVASLLAALGVAGCTDETDDTDDIETTVLGGCDVRKEGQGVMRRQAEFETFWVDNCEGESPVVDMGDAVVVWHAWGEHPTGGYTVALESVQQQEGGVTVTFRRTAPGDSCGVAAALTYPTAVVVLHGRPDAVEIKHVVATHECAEAMD